MSSYLLSMLIKPFQNWYNLKERILTKGSKFFSLTVNQKECKNKNDRVVSPKGASIHLKSSRLLFCICI